MNSRNSPRRGRDEEVRVQLPLLDRLIDDAPDARGDLPLSAAEADEALKRSVRRDLEALLNSRRRWRSWDAGYAELATSLIGYGIADFASGAFNHVEQRDRLRADVELAIRRFEPRLSNIKVTLIERPDNLASTLHLRVDAMLRTEPAPEPIAFDTLVDASTAEIFVRANANPEASDGV